MKRILTAGLIFIFALLVSPLSAQEKETLVLIDTDMGKIKVKLFNETPLHRDNFIQNVNSHWYDNTVFHRVIKQFMIQGGGMKANPSPADSLQAEKNDEKTIPAEFIYPTYFHKCGMLCAARTSDDENPGKASSSTQFYIVTGKFYTAMELDKMESTSLKIFTPEQREAYMLEGGTPHLDGNYTVFGEVVSGMKVVDKIQFVQTNEKDRPIKDVKIKTMTIVNK